MSYQEELQDSILRVVERGGAPVVSAVVAPRISTDVIYLSGDLFIYGSVQTPLRCAAGIEGLTFNNGTALAPTLAFAGDTSSGYYLAAPALLGVSISGAPVAAFSTNGLTSIGGDLKISSATTNIDFNGKNLINVGGIATNPNSYEVLPGAQVVTTNNTQTTLITMPTVSNAMYTIVATVTAAESGGAMGSFQLSIVVKNIAGVITLGSAYNRDKSIDALLSTCNILYSSSSSNILLNVIGVNAATIKWFGSLRIVRSLM